MADGRISLDHLELFADLHRERFADAWTEAYPLLVDYATVARFEDVARQAQRFADDLSPKDADDRFNEQVEGRTFTKATTIDGFGHLQGFLDPLTYAIFAAEHDRLVGIEYQADLAIAREVLGRDPDPLELAQITRTPTQRSADAMRVMAQRSKTLAGGAVAAAAEIVIHMTQDQYEAGVAHDLGDESAVGDPDGFCELDDGTVISPIAALYLASIANFRRIVYDADDEIINYSKARRGYAPPQYGALRAKYRRCAHPWGCDRTGRALQADHIQEHSDGGPTDCAQRPMPLRLPQPLEDQTQTRPTPHHPQRHRRPKSKTPRPLLTWGVPPRLRCPASPSGPRPRPRSPPAVRPGPPRVVPPGTTSARRAGRSAVTGREPPPMGLVSPSGRARVRSTSSRVRVRNFVRRPCMAQRASSTSATSSVDRGSVGPAPRRTSSRWMKYSERLMAPSSGRSRAGGPLRTRATRSVKVDPSRVASRTFSL